MATLTRLASVLLCCAALGQAGDPGEKDVQAALRKGLALAKQGKHRAAGQEYEKAVRLAERQYGPDDARLARPLNLLGLAYVRQFRHAEAEPLYRRALKIWEDEHGPRHPAVAVALNNLAELYRQQGRYAAAEPPFRRALAIREKRHGRDHPEVAVLLNNLARLYEDQGRYAEAEPLSRRSLAIRERAHGKDHPEVSRALNSLGRLCTEQARYDEAEKLLRRALAVREANPDAGAPSAAVVLNNLGLLYHRQARFDEAEESFRRALDLDEKDGGQDRPESAGTLDNLAAVLRDRGRYAAAEPWFRRALTIREARLGAGHPQVATSLNNLALLYLQQGRHAEAEQLLRRALTIREAKLGAGHPHVATLLGNLARVHVEKGRYAEAGPLLERGLRIEEAALGPDHPRVAAALHGLAGVCRDRGQLAEAEPLFRRALKIREARLGADHPATADSVNGLAVLYLRQGRPAEAEPLFRRALAAREAKLGADHPFVAHSYQNLAMALAAAGQTAEAARLFQHARRGQNQHLRVSLVALSAPQQLAFLARNLALRQHVALSLALRHRQDPGMAELAAGWLLNGKGLAHEALAEPLALARTAAADGLKAPAAELLRVRGRAAALTLADAAPGEEGRRRDELAGLLRRERELTAELAVRGGRPAEDAWAELATLRRALPGDAVFLDFARLTPFDFPRGRWLPARYVVVVVPPAGRGTVELIDLGPAAAVERAVRAVRQALENAPTAVAEEGEPAAERALKERLGRLAELVLKPLPGHVDRSARWVVGPDAALWLVPFEALPLPDGRYAVEAHAVRYVTSGRDLLRPAPAAAKPGPALVLADPDYDGPAGAAPLVALRGSAPAEKLPRFARLPGTAEEAAAVAPALRRLTRAEPVVKTGKEATEEAVKAARAPRVLVLSTHGYFLPDQEALLPELFADAPRAALSKSGKPLENPLLRCGLALAGANKKGPRPEGAEDGILTGLEVVGCDLGGTELVVLSACETGLGQVNRGEGVAGLRQAFHLAGAKAVLASLWQVPDRPTADLMGTFFAELEKGGDHAAALRRAQLRLMRQRRELDGTAHPFFWAAFTLTAAGN